MTKAKRVSLAALALAGVLAVAAACENDRGGVTFKMGEDGSFECVRDEGSSKLDGEAVGNMLQSLSAAPDELRRALMCACVGGEHCEPAEEDGDE